MTKHKHDEDIDDFDLSKIDIKEHPEYKALEEKSQENLDKAVRARADLDNLRKRFERAQRQEILYVLQNFIESILPVMDSLYQAMQLSSSLEMTSMYEGLALTAKLFNDALHKAGVQPLDPVGEVFDPVMHEAMSMQEANDKPNNTVLEVFQKGYKLHDRVIRPARVVVSKKTK